MVLFNRRKLKRQLPLIGEELYGNTKVIKWFIKNKTISLLIPTGIVLFIVLCVSMMTIIETSYSIKLNIYGASLGLFYLLLIFYYFVFICLLMVYHFDWFYDISYTLVLTVTLVILHLTWITRGLRIGLNNYVLDMSALTPGNPHEALAATKTVCFSYPLYVDIVVVASVFVFAELVVGADLYQALQKTKKPCVG
jgi:hypothetical protein